jgi:hypothetical protein
MKGKRVQFGDEIWAAIEAVAHQQGVSFQDLADEAFKDLLKKHHQPVGFKASLQESLGGKESKSSAKIVKLNPRKGR